MENEEDQLFTYLLEVGAVILDGVSKDGEFLYKIDPDLMREYCPQLLDVFQEDLESSLMDLYQKGLVDVSYNEDLEAIFNVSDHGKEEIEKYGFYNMDSPED